MPIRNFPAPGWREYVEDWLNSLKTANMAASTIATRRCQICALSRALGDTPVDATDDDLIHYFASHDWKAETRKSARNAVVGFFGWLNQTGRRDDDPSSALPSVRRPQAHPRPCPDAVILKALAKADYEERLMIRLGAECGLRRHEIAKVHSRDVINDLVGRSLIVNGKGDKQRIVPLPNDLADIIEKAEGHLFPGRWGGHVEASYVGKRVTRLLDDEWTCHSLRHRYATRTYEATHDLFLVAKLLGHASVETSQIYVAMPAERLRAAVSAVQLSA